MKNLREYDKLTVQEKRQLMPYASEYLAKMYYAKKGRQRVMLAQRQEENGYVEELDDGRTSGQSN